jgi:hypothetical protein
MDLMKKTLGKGVGMAINEVRSIIIMIHRTVLLPSTKRNAIAMVTQRTPYIKDYIVRGSVIYDRVNILCQEVCLQCLISYHGGLTYHPLFHYDGKKDDYNYIREKKRIGEESMCVHPSLDTWPSSRSSR